MPNKHLKFNTGDTCVSIDRVSKKYGHIIVLGEFNEEFQRWGYSIKHNPQKPVRFTIAKDLKEKRFMSQNDFDYYYSNEKHHIDKAEEIRSRGMLEAKIKRTLKKTKEKEFFEKLNLLLEEYGVEIHATQTEGDSHGVEVEVEYDFF